MLPQLVLHMSMPTMVGAVSSWNDSLSISGFVSLSSMIPSHFHLDSSSIFYYCIYLFCACVLLWVSTWVSKDSLLVSVVFVHQVDDQTQMARLGSKLLSVLRHLTTQE